MPAQRLRRLLHSSGRGWFAPATSALALAVGSAAAVAQTSPGDRPVAGPAAAASAPAPASPPAAAPREGAARAGPERAGARAGEAGRIEVTGRRSPTEERRLSSAAKIVVGREEIEQFGDLGLGDVLKRLPSVTVGGRPGRGGGQIRMRGMGGGYTQILVDGERVPPGFSLDQIPPDQVERIEIYRAPTAETGARAVAGTINVVLREPLRINGDDVRVGVSNDRRGVRPNASWTRNATVGERGTYALNLSANGSEQRTPTQSDTVYEDAASGVVLRRLHRESVQHDVRRSANLNGRFQWRLGEAGSGEQLSVQPFVAFSQGRSDGRGRLVQSDGLQLYDEAASEGSNRSVQARLMANGRHRIGEGTRLEWRAMLGRLSSHSESQLLQTRLGVATPVLRQRSETDINDRSWSAGLKLAHTWLDRHSLVAGLEGEGVRRSEEGLQRAESAASSVSGAPMAVDVDGDLRARTERVAAYVQDEWDPAPHWSAHAGLRWEQIRTRSDALSNPVANTGRVLTPMGHLVWRFDQTPGDPRRRQLRLSLTRSYRSPTLGNLTALPRFNASDPVPGPNTAITPDRAGNPDLRPELARGIDLAYEHYLGSGGVVSISAYARQIDDLIRQVTALESVPWATAPRWVSRPRNIGDARTQGVELDAKARLEELWAAAPDALKALALRGNLGLYRSQVSGIVGPDNRIDQQPRLTVNLGADYRVRGWPLMVGGNVSAVPGYAVQQSETQRQTIGRTRVVDTYLLWNVSPVSRWRVSVGNAVPLDYRNATRVEAAGQRQTTTSAGATYRVLSLRFETRL